MRFSLQDVKKSVHRRGGELSVSLHFLRAGELEDEIERLIAYHERLLGMPQRQFSSDDARACIGEYRLAQCLIATLSHWYSWRQREWTEVVSTLDVSPELSALTSAVQLRLALYTYVNERYQGFLGGQKRTEALQSFAETYQLHAADLEALLTLDSEEEALLVRDAPVPGVQEVITIYNQWAFEAALFNSSSVRFVIDCNAFSALSSEGPQWQNVGMGVGAVIKRLCYLARRLGVYYDLAYDSAPLDRAAAWGSNTLLTLTLYGPQDVTGVPQQYGLRLARLCRLLLGYSSPRNGAGRTKKQTLLSTAIVEAQATVHFLQRTYNFVMDAYLLQLLPPVTMPAQERGRAERDSVDTLFDSSIEQTFSDAFMALARSQGVDGWRLEREPEPLLLERSIFIPDFALTRDQQRIYVEILGFWTPSYRERKIQKLQELQERRDLLLAIPRESVDAFSAIIPLFPVVIYDGQLQVTDVVQVLRESYDDFAERLARFEPAEVRQRVQREGFLVERDCYSALHCYRRSEIQRVAERVINAEIAFVPGIGLYTLGWMNRVQQAFISWLRTMQKASLEGALQEIKAQWPVLQTCEDATLETLLGLWPQVQIRRDSIFEAIVELAESNTEVVSSVEPEIAEAVEPEAPAKSAKKRTGEKRTAPRKRAAHEAVQGGLWGE